MRNSIAVTVGLKYRFEDFPPGTILTSGDETYIKISLPKYPLVNLANGEIVHWETARKMEFGLLNVGSRLTVTITQKPKLRVRNKYIRIKRPVVERILG
jgi:hypothetical protein